MPEPEFAGLARGRAENPEIERLMPPAGGATVRMYRIGHGDCFLVAVAGDDPEKPVYVLIDCGYKPGSSKPEFIGGTGTKAAEIAAHIAAATGGFVDVAVITHEHQDHVNGISAKNFEALKIGRTWLAWTEDPQDELANRLRARFRDQLVGLGAMRLRMAADSKTLAKVDELLAFELGGDSEDFDAGAALGGLLGAAGGGPSLNKISMKVFKDKAAGVDYLRPHESVLAIPGASTLRVYALGPPRDEELLATLDPEGDEEFHLRAAPGAWLSRPDADKSSFAPRFQLARDQALAEPFFQRHYAPAEPEKAPAIGEAPDEVAGNAAWRRIDDDWLGSAEQLALAMNSQTNNASLVLAFELGKGGKILLFAADAQRGNWLSWARKQWRDGDETLEARDLLARTVLYKVGHHGSHNATLNGKNSDEFANLSWMATAPGAAHEFTAMITAVRAWAETQKGWDHPLKAIKDALLKKAGGRVFQTDTGLEKLAPSAGSEEDWPAFQSRVRGDRLYFDIDILP